MATFWEVKKLLGTSIVGPPSKIVLTPPVASFNANPHAAPSTSMDFKSWPYMLTGMMLEA